MKPLRLNIAYKVRETTHPAVETRGSSEPTRISVAETETTIDVPPGASCSIYLPARSVPIHNHANHEG